VAVAVAEILEGVRPTRMELLKVKDKLELATKGHRLLKEKRDALMMEVMRLSGRAGGAGGNAVKKTVLARRSFAKSRGVMSSSAVEISALDCGGGLSVDVGFRNIMGVSVPEIDSSSLEMPKPGYSRYSTKPVLDETSRMFFGAVEALLELAEVESSLRALSDETKKTRRRVNALEYNRIPQLHSTKKHIQLRLDELERENYYRLKMVKKKKLK